MTCFSRLLRSGLPLWRRIASPSVVSWIKDGVSLPFRQGLSHGPDSFYIPNTDLSPASQTFITNEIRDLLRHDVIEEVHRKPHCVSPIYCVPKKTG